MATPDSPPSTQVYDVMRRPHGPDQDRGRAEIEHGAGFPSFRAYVLFAVLHARPAICEQGVASRAAGDVLRAGDGVRCEVNIARCCARRVAQKSSRRAVWLID